MKSLVFVIVLILVCSLNVKAQSDTLLITLKNNQVEKIAVFQIQKIQFENVTAVAEKEQTTGNLITKGNYPNPFYVQTSIEFEIAESGNVVVTIFDNSGNQIQSLECKDCQAGKNTLQWNCVDKNNKHVQSGVYFYEVRFKNEIQARKMLVIK